MKRGSYRTGAVVLSSLSYGESDRILAFYTGDFGKVRGIAKGALRSRKRFVGNNLEPLSHVRLGFFHNGKAELVRVEESLIVEGFGLLRSDIEMMARGQYLLELTNEMTREGAPMPQVFTLILDFLRLLDAGEDPGPMMRFFEMKLLTLLGYLPHLEGCVVCKGAIARTPSAFFSAEKGGIVCAMCEGGEEGLTPVTLSTARLLSTAVRFDPEKLARLKTDAAFARESHAMLGGFIRHQIGKELKTKVFLDKLKTAVL